MQKLPGPTRFPSDLRIASQEARAIDDERLLKSARVFPGPSYPTPVFRVAALSTENASVWVKNEGELHSLYGGNKVRKIVRLVEAAKARSARRILTLGALGSHHVLTTAIFAKAHGLEAGAVLTRQPITEHVRRTLRAALGQGLEPYPLYDWKSLWNVLTRVRRADDYLVPPGGSNVIGASAYADAVHELSEQIGQGELPEPDVIVVPLGSGGTCAGLLAGVILEGLKTQILGVEVLKNPLARAVVRGLAARVTEARGEPASDSTLDRSLRLTSSFIGKGYGHSTELVHAARDRGRSALGLELDDTYTGKALACVLSLAERPRLRSRRPLNVLYWHTLSSVALEPLLEAAPADAELSRWVPGLL